MNTADLGAKLQVLGRSAALGSGEPPRRVLYPLAGAFLALGAPGGLLLLRWFASDAIPSDLLRWLGAELAWDATTYAYLVVATTTVFGLLGRILGASVDRLRSLAITDPLTGLFNRRYFKLRLEHEVLRAGRYRTPLSLLIVDVDYLKAINDREGHAAGDKAIMEVARTIRDQLRGTDIGARYGGDEFAVLLPHTNGEEALVIADRVRADLRMVEVGAKALTVSIGISELGADLQPSKEALLLGADAALYRAKSDGRDCSRLAAPAEASKELSSVA
jgi:diguanylate cyclase (GGDEF)-like protein